MSPLAASAGQHGLEDLRWQSLTRPERLFVARLMERAEGAPPHAHLENVAFELVESASAGRTIALVLTGLQNRLISELIGRLAASLEERAETSRPSQALYRSAHYAAGFLHSLLDRLVRGGATDCKEARERIVQLMLVDPPRVDTLEGLPGALLAATAERLRPLGVAEIFRPVLRQHAAEAAQQLTSEDVPLDEFDDEGCDFEILDAGEAEPADFDIVDTTQERREVAKRTFDAAMRALWEDEGGWYAFLGRLGAGQIPGCERAPEYRRAAQDAATLAHLLAFSIRGHLRETAAWPWEAVSPGLKAILDRYPVLKRRAVLRDFVRAQVGLRGARASLELGAGPCSEPSRGDGRRKTEDG